MWVLVLRDAILSVLGMLLIGKELLSRNPDPIILEIGAGLTGIPAWLHRRHITRTELGQLPSVVSPSLEPPALPSIRHSEGE